MQGNDVSELPELILGCARVSRIDLSKAQPFPAHLRKTKSHRMTVEMDKGHPALSATTFPDDDLSPQPPDGAEEFLNSSRSNHPKAAVAGSQ